jgi:hypothetical protein
MTSYVATARTRASAKKGFLNASAKRDAMASQQARRAREAERRASEWEATLAARAEMDAVDIERFSDERNTRACDALLASLQAHHRPEEVLNYRAFRATRGV